MSTAAYAAAFIFGVLPVLIGIFLAGKYSERQAWNKLIEDGIIPRPSRRGNR